MIRYDAGVYGWLVGLISIAACYAPVTPLDVPCSPNGACPDGQTCVADTCVFPSGDTQDAAVHGDAGTATDRDGDGVANLADNCPDVANADQGNEDGDKFGDVCDPCPPVAGDSPSDADGDGVADACDPNPQTPGDRIELFEGFHHGLPVWARTASWTVAGDSVRATAAASTSEYLALPIMNPDHVTVAASVVVEQVVANTPAHDIDVAVPNDVSSDTGIDCQLYQPADVSGRDISLWDDFSRKEIGQQALAWTNNTAYAVSLTHRGQSYTCDVVDPAGTRSVATGTSSSSGGSQPTAVVRAYAVTARVNWVMVVRSP